MAKLNNSILTHGVSFPYGNRRLGIARIRRLQFIASPTFDGAVKSRFHTGVGVLMMVYVYFTRPTDWGIV